MINQLALKTALKDDEFWSKYLESADFTIHLAVMVEPYYQLLLDGVKTIESRFSKNKIAPYLAISPKDIILIKKSSMNSITGICRARQVMFYKLDQKILKEIKDKYQKELCVDSDFWDKKSGSRYATLIRVANVIKICPLSVNKKDSRGWVVLKDQCSLKRMSVNSQSV